MPKPATAPLDSPDTLFVQDTTCLPGGPPREHMQIVEGIETPFAFLHGRKTELPYAVALKFLKIPEFIVTDRRGERVERTPEQPDRHQNRPFLLAEDQVVAGLAELSDAALLKRAQQQVGGERLRPADGRKALIEFLLNARRAGEAQRRGVPEALAPDAIADLED